MSKTIRDEVVDFAWRRDLDMTEVVEFWSERAAVREYLGGQGRRVAEMNALDRDVVERYAPDEMGSLKDGTL
jgi:hypothetical protein